MPTVLPKSVFYHIPKTGGTWVTEVLKGIGGERVQVEGTHPYNITKEHATPLVYRTQKFKFAFVRHPVSWYQSMWKFRANNKWQYESVFDVKLPFTEWVRHFLKQHPGIYSEIVREFEGVDFMGRQENLRADLLKALEMSGDDTSGIEIDRGLANKSKGTARVSKKLRNEIMEAESYVMRYYES